MTIDATTTDATTTDATRGDDPGFKDGSRSFGAFYPKHYVLAVLSDEATAERAGAALGAAGFAPGDVIVTSGPDALAQNATASAQEGVVARLREQWSRLYTDGAATSKQLLDFADRGAAFVFAYAPEDAEMNRAADALRPLAPVLMRSYGDFTVTDLT